METATQIEINKLEALAFSIQKDGIRQEDLIYTNDLTEDFKNELNIMVENKEPINIQINGKVGSGKSVLGLKITKVINQLYGKEMNIKRIASDQSDLMEMLLQKERTYEAIHIDEYNVLMDTGYDSTTNEALMRWYSDVCAQKHVARISCNPSSIADKNTTIVLTILGQDKKNKTTTAKIGWKITEAGLEKIIDLGFIQIYIGDILAENWYKNEYLEKKFMRMNLLLEKGVRNIRELQFAQLIQATYKELKPLCGEIKMSEGIILAFANTTARKQKQFHSILTEYMLTDKINGLITLETARLKKEKDLEKALERQLSEDKIEKEKAVLQRLTEAVNVQEEELNTLAEIKKEYDDIWRE